MGVASGFRDVDRKLVEAARMYRLGLLPWYGACCCLALPAVLTGLRNGLSLAWMFMVAAELIAATRGLGYLLTDGREMGRADIAVPGRYRLAGAPWQGHRHWHGLAGAAAAGMARHHIYRCLEVDTP